MTTPVIRVLIVDDEPAIRRALHTPLTALGFDVVEVSRGEKALQVLRTENFDCVLLDVNMPGIGGLETLRRIRVFAPRLPVLILTVRDGEDEKVRALEMGADDYVTKPFGIRELVARMRAAVRRIHAPVRTEEEPLEIGEIRLVPARRSVTKRGQAIHLTRKEFDILHCLMSRPAGWSPMPACSPLCGAPIAVKRWSIFVPSCVSCAKRSKMIRPGRCIFSLTFTSAIDLPTRRCSRKRRQLQTNPARNSMQWTMPNRCPARRTRT